MELDLTKFNPIYAVIVVLLIAIIAVGFRLTEFNQSREAVFTAGNTTSTNFPFCDDIITITEKVEQSKLKPVIYKDLYAWGTVFPRDIYDPVVPYDLSTFNSAYIYENAYEQRLAVENRIENIQSLPTTVGVVDYVWESPLTRGDTYNFGIYDNFYEQSREVFDQLAINFYQTPELLSSAPENVPNKKTFAPDNVERFGATLEQVYSRYLPSHIMVWGTGIEDFKPRPGETFADSYSELLRETRRRTENKYRDTNIVASSLVNRAEITNQDSDKYKAFEEFLVENNGSLDIDYFLFEANGTEEEIIGQTCRFSSLVRNNELNRPIWLRVVHEQPTSEEDVAIQLMLEELTPETIEALRYFGVDRFLIEEYPEDQLIFDLEGKPSTRYRNLETQVF